LLDLEESDVLFFEEPESDEGFDLSAELFDSDSDPFAPPDELLPSVE